MASSADLDELERVARRFVDDRGDAVYQVLLKREDVSSSSSADAALVYRTGAESKLTGATVRWHSPIVSL